MEIFIGMAKEHLNALKNDVKATNEFAKVAATIELICAN